MAFEITKQEIIKQAIALNTLWKQTRDQKYRDEELRLRRIALELENTVIGGTGVTSIIAGSNITINPIDGKGDVTINADGGTVTIRTVDEFIASEGQTDFVISVAFDFFDVYLNGARLIESEYTLVVNTVSLVSPAEVDDEIIIISYKDTGLAQLPKDYDVLHDFVTPYSYIGKALADTSISVNAWNIKRIEILEDGSTVVTTATNVNWTNRYTHTYS